MPQTMFVAPLGKNVNFPDDWSDDQIVEWVRKQSGDAGPSPTTDLGGAFSHGWKSGWADTADSYSDYKDAILRLLPGVDPKEDALDRASQRLSADAAGFTPDTFTEKLASGLGAVPAGLIGLIPAIGATMAAAPAGFAAPAIGFGLHGAVRAQDEGLEGIIGGAAGGALEGAAFGALGKALSAAKPLKKALGHAAGAAGIGGMSSAAHQSLAGEDIDPEQVTADAAVLGLLGLTPLAKGKPKLDAAPVGDLKAPLDRYGGLRPMTTQNPIQELLGRKESLLLAARDKAVAMERKAVNPEYASNLHKYISPEQYPILDELIQKKILPPEGPKTHKEFIEAMRKDGREIEAIKAQSESTETLAAIAEGKGKKAMRITGEQFQGALDELVKHRAKTLEAERVGDPQAATLREQLMEKQAVLGYFGVEFNEFGTAAGQTLGVRSAMKRGMDLGQQAILEIAKKDATNVKLMEQVIDLREAGDWAGIRNLMTARHKPKLSDKLHEVWLMGLLSNPLTWGPTGVNVWSNMGMQGLNKVTRAVAIPIDKMMSSVLGTGKRAVTPDHLKTEMIADGMSYMPALRSLWQNMKSEGSFDGGKLEMNYGPAISGRKGRMIRIPGRHLEAWDTFFRDIAKTRETALIAKEKKGRVPTREEIQELTDAMNKEPHKYLSEYNRIKAAGDELVFTTPLSKQAAGGGIGGLIGAPAGTIQKFKNTKHGGWAKLFFPFVRTPANIAIEALKTSPFGFFEGVRLAKDLKSQQAQYQRSGKTMPDNMVERMQRDVSEQFAKATIGSVLFATFLQVARDGKMTGGGPVEYDDYQKWTEAGNQPYSVKLGDKWISYQRIEPFASILGAAADMWETKQTDENKMSRAWAAMKDNLANKTFMMGAENLVQAWANPKRYGARAYQNLMSTFMPFSSASGWAARAIDPVTRIQSGAEGNMLEQGVQLGAKALASKIPGMRSGLEPRVSATGREIQDEYSLFNALSPLRAAPATAPSIVESEIARLTNLGFNTPNPERRKRKVPGLEKTHLVTPEEYKVFTETNQRAAATLERIMSAKSWRTIDEETKVKIINHIYNRYRRGSGKRVRSMMRRRLTS